MSNTINVKYNNNGLLQVPTNTKIIEVIQNLPESIKNRIIGVKINNEIIDMNSTLKKDTTLNFFDVNDLAGYKMYIAGLKFVMELAIKHLYGKDKTILFNHSIARGVHCTIQGIDDVNINKIKNEMSSIIEKDLPFTKLNIDSKEAINYYQNTNNIEKAKNIHNITNPIITLYRLENEINYYYTDMPYSTKCLRKFDLIQLNTSEIVLLFPTPRTKNTVPEYIHYEKVINCFKNEKAWLQSLKIPFISNVNDIVSASKIKDLIRICETNYDNHIHDVALDAIKKGAKYIMISGPSSSGKTTTTKKMALNLEAQGIKTVLLSVDDYFLNRVDSPKNPDGTYNFECLESLDLELLNKDLNALNNHEEVEIPTFNFISGEREYNGNKVKLAKDGVILMEGLHCLNDKLTYGLDPKLKYKIYLSPFIPLNIDRHNYISTVDLRLIRRMIRDNRTRGYDVSKTIHSWQSVRNGEEKYIFPFIDSADKIINTALAYEVGVLKVYVEPLLYSVTNDSPYYEEARRIIKFLKNFFPISSESISKDSVLREFIGGSNFE